MASATFAFPDLENSVVVTTVDLPRPQNPPALTVTSQARLGLAVERMQATQLDAVVQKSRNITDLLSEYLRRHLAFANSTFAITYTLSLDFQPAHQIPARRTPFGHLDFLASPVEGVYLDPDDLVG